MGKGGRYREKGAGGAGEWWVGGWVGVMVRGWGGGEGRGWWGAG